MSSTWQPKIRLPLLVSINLWVLWYPSFGHWFTRLPAGLHLYQIRKIQYVWKHGFYWTSDIWLKYLTHNWICGGRSLPAVYRYYRYSSWNSPYSFSLVSYLELLILITLYLQKIHIRCLNGRDGFCLEWSVILFMISHSRNISPYFLNAPTRPVCRILFFHIVGYSTRSNP